MKFIVMNVSVRVPATSFGADTSPSDRVSLTRLALEEHSAVERALIGAEIVEVREQRA